MIPTQVPVLFVLQQCKNHIFVFIDEKNEEKLWVLCHNSNWPWHSSSLSPANWGSVHLAAPPGCTTWLVFVYLWSFLLLQTTNLSPVAQYFDCGHLWFLYLKLWPFFNDDKLEVSPFLFCHLGRLSEAVSVSLSPHPSHNTLFLTCSNSMGCLGWKPPHLWIGIPRAVA